jgi:hypothetical protein
VEKESEILKYPIGKKIEEAVLTVIIVVAMVFILKSEASTLIKSLLTVVMIGFLALILSHSYLLNKNFEIDSESLTINNIFGKSNKILFRNIQRVTVREEKGTDSYLTVMTIFESRKTTRIIVSDFADHSKMQYLIGEKGKKFGFNVIHQNLKGKIISQTKNQRPSRN